MYKHFFAQIVANIWELREPPDITLAHYYKLPQHFLVLSSHALCVLGSFSHKGIILYLSLFFWAFCWPFLLLFALFADGSSCKIKLISDWKWTDCLKSSNHHMASSWRILLQLNFYWLKTCALCFQTSVQMFHFLIWSNQEYKLFSDGKVRIRDQMLVSKFNHSIIHLQMF